MIGKICILARNISIVFQIRADENASKSDYEGRLINSFAFYVKKNRNKFDESSICKKKKQSQSTIFKDRNKAK